MKSLYNFTYIIVNLLISKHFCGRLKRNRMFLEDSILHQYERLKRGFMFPGDSIFIVSL